MVSARTGVTGWLGNASLGDLKRKEHTGKNAACSTRHPCWTTLSSARCPSRHQLLFLLSTHAHARRLHTHAGALIPLLGGAFITDARIRLAVVAVAATLGLLAFGLMGSVLGGAKPLIGSIRVRACLCLGLAGSMGGWVHGCVRVPGRRPMVGLRAELRRGWGIGMLVNRRGWTAHVTTWFALRHAAGLGCPQVLVGGCLAMGITFGVGHVLGANPGAL